MRDMYVVGLVWGTCMPCILEEGQVCSKFCMRDTCVVNFVWGKRMWWVLYKGLACARFCIWGIYVIRQMHEGEHSNWLYKTIIQLSHLYQVELSLFSTKAFSKLNFPFSLTIFKHILALPVHAIKLLLYITNKSKNHLILEVKLSS